MNKGASLGPSMAIQVTENTLTYKLSASSLHFNLLSSPLFLSSCEDERSESKGKRMVSHWQDRIPRTLCCDWKK